MSEVTRTLDRIQAGDPKAAEELPPMVYDELPQACSLQDGQ